MKDGIFSVDEMNRIRDAHQLRCAEHAVESRSPLGREAVSLLIEAYQGGQREPEQLVAALDAFTEARQENVELGLPAIETVSDTGTS